MATLTGIPEQIGAYKLGATPKKLGQGSFGVVFLGIHEETEAHVAIKRVTNITWEVTQRELDTIRQVQGHPNILAMLQTIEDESNFVCWLVTEYCDLGNLSEYTTNFHLDNRHKLNIMLQCSRGLSHLHGSERCVVHRDMKPDNVLLRTENGSHVAKIADFGVSKVIETIADLRTFTGTLPYMAPEMLMDRKDPRYSQLVDVFASGLVFLQLLLAIPGKGLGQLGTSSTALGSQMNMLKTDIPMTVVKIEMEDTGLVLRIKQILANMICEDPDSRLNMAEVAERLDKLRKSLRSPPTMPVRYSATAASGGVMTDTRFDDLDEEDTPATLYGCGNDAKLSRPASRSTRTLAPEIKVSTPTYQCQNTLCLSFQSNARIAFSDEEIILENAAANSLVCYKVLAQGGFSKKWEKQKPFTLKLKSRKYVLGGKLYARYRDDNETLVFSPDLEPVRTICGDYGRLRGTIHPDKLVYCKRQPTGYRIQIYKVSGDDHELTTTLAATYSSYRVSVCEHRSSGYTAVVDDGQDTLHIFDASGQVKHLVYLRFSPQLSHAVAATRTWIAVASCYWRDDIHLYNWRGEEVGVIRRAPGWFWEGGVHGIATIRGKLLVPTGPWGTEGVTKLHVFSPD